MNNASVQLCVCACLLRYVSSCFWKEVGCVWVHCWVNLWSTLLFIFDAFFLGHVPSRALWFVHLSKNALLHRETRKPLASALVGKTPKAEISLLTEGLRRGCSCETEEAAWSLPAPMIRWCWPCWNCAIRSKHKCVITASISAPAAGTLLGQM